MTEPSPAVRIVEPDPEARPALRGVIHKYSSFIAGAVGIVLIVGTAMHQSAVAVASVVVYVITICGLFTTSTVYHRINWRSPKARIAMKRADHSMIFVFIAGTYSPFCVMGLDSPTRWWVLGLVWAGAIAGVALKVIWPGSPRWLGVVLYIVLGWVIVWVSPMLVHNTGVAVIVLLALGGVLYSVGGVLYALRWPEPWPGVFGHHEVFHSCTAVAALLHYIAVWLVVIG
ncbi:PAQR family membrane homeostasis protein TrhA [Gordonia neofelifaecis]|uniref:Channel protein, hemolysin III family n=1 Tax=Gordonia neofelifaecis NRRL B-59395 TaxID=644548 RepID=F1YFF2_9ACTN|nr:hemolysin III family protein [Gordonia neofelifaecis]EGD56440.1 channel protein, hemolysin III family [Gordonia neofelifaecis NRRL B-59395]